MFGGENATFNGCLAHREKWAGNNPEKVRELPWRYGEERKEENNTKADPKQLEHPPTRTEPKGAKTTSEPKKAATPTNTKAARSKVALRTPTVNCLGKSIQSRL